MAHRKYNHSRRIRDLQPAKIKSLHPGTIVQFRYSGDKVFDKKPMVLILWNDYKEYKIHGINLNYLIESKIKMLFSEVMERGDVLVEEDQDDDRIKRTWLTGEKQEQDIKQCTDQDGPAASGQDEEPLVGHGAGSSQEATHRQKQHL